MWPLGQQLPPPLGLHFLENGATSYPPWVNIFGPMGLQDPRQGSTTYLPGTKFSGQWGKKLTHLSQYSEPNQLQVSQSE